MLCLTPRKVLRHVMPQTFTRLEVRKRYNPYNAKLILILNLMCVKFLFGKSSKIFPDLNCPMLTQSKYFSDIVQCLQKMSKHVQCFAMFASSKTQFAANCSMLNCPSELTSAVYSWFQSCSFRLICKLCLFKLCKTHRLKSSHLQCKTLSVSKLFSTSRKQSCTLCTINWSLHLQKGKWKQCICEKLQIWICAKHEPLCCDSFLNQHLKFSVTLCNKSSRAFYLQSARISNIHR